MIRPRQFRFGLLGESIRAATELVETARRAEGAGFAMFLLRDHFIEEPLGHQLAPVTALATAGAATATLRVESLVGSVVITENRREAAERLVHPRGWDGLSAEKVFEMPSIFIGSVDQIVEEMQGRVNATGFHTMSYQMAVWRWSHRSSHALQECRSLPGHGRRSLSGRALGLSQMSESRRS